MSRRRRAHLLLLSPRAEDGTLRLFPFEGARMTVGRDAACSIQLELPGVSGSHARLERPRSGVTLRIQDQGSRNGTFVDGGRVPARGADCAPDSLIRVGDALLLHRLLHEDEAEIVARPPRLGATVTRHPPLVQALEALQYLPGDGDPIWLAGEPGSGRSMVLRALQELAAKRGEAEPDIRVSEELPADAKADRSCVVPPLKERIEDLLPLVDETCGGSAPKMHPRLVEAIHRYPWPGNVRELRVQFARAKDPRFAPPPGLAWDLDAIPDLRLYLDRYRRTSEGAGKGKPEPVTEPGARVLPEHIDAAGLRELLEENRWKLWPTAQALGTNIAGLLKDMARLGIRGPWE